jgi:hypothetical protein
MNFKNGDKFSRVKILDLDRSPTGSFDVLLEKGKAFSKTAAKAL